MKPVIMLYYPYIGDFLVKYQRLRPNLMANEWSPQGGKKGESYVHLARKVTEYQKKSILEYTSYFFSRSNELHVLGTPFVSVCTISNYITV